MPYKYHCFNTECRKECHFCDIAGDIILDSSSDNFICPNDPAEKLKEMGTTGMMVLGEKMSKDAIKADRKKRSREHFQKETMPYLPKNEQAAFIRKGFQNK